MGNMISFTGSQGTGKTTSAMDQATHLKYYHPGKTITTLLQVESLCPFPINEGTTYESQMWIFARQMTQELKLSSRFDLVVSDRTLVDAAAYSLVAGMEGLAMAMLDLAEHHMHLYQKITFKKIKNNPFCFNDGHRSTDMAFRQKVEDTLLDMFATLEERGALSRRVDYT